MDKLIANITIPNEPPTDKCIDEAGWAEFGKRARKEEEGTT